MTTSDLRRAGLDPAHIQAICEHVAASGGHRPVGYVTAAPDGARVRPQPVRAARQMQSALTCAGCGVVLVRTGRPQELLVTGWDERALESRLAAMRAVTQQLHAGPAATAAVVIDRYRCLSARCSGSRLGIAALTQAREELRVGVATRCGIHAPRDAAALPAGTGNALRLRAIWVLEHAIDDLIERHLRLARRALTLPGPADRPPAVPAQQAALGFSVTAADALAAGAVRPRSGVATYPVARAADSPFPGCHPGRSR